MLTRDNKRRWLARWEICMTRRWMWWTGSKSRYRVTMRRWSGDSV